MWLSGARNIPKSKLELIASENFTSPAVMQAVGSVLTWQIIAAGHNPEGLQAVPIFSWATLWLFCKVGLLLLWLARRLAGANDRAQKAYGRAEERLANAKISDEEDVRGA
jgi:membrane protein implicated in regulation of membrane protease activity